MSISIFISHSSKDIEFSEKLARDIQTATGIECWLDKYEIKAGDCIISKMNDGLTKCDYMILVLSPDSVNSGWVDKEWKTKYWDEISTGKTILIAAYLNECTIPKVIQTKKYADFRADYYKGLFELLSGVVPKLLNLNKIKPRELISKIQSNEISLSEAIPLALGIAEDCNNNDLCIFCKTELTGIAQTADENFFKYRYINAHFSTIHIYQVTTIPQLKNYIIQNKNDFFEKRLFFSESITTIEEFYNIDKNSPESLFLRHKIRTKDVTPTCSDDFELHVYIFPSEMRALYTKIKSKLIDYLLKIG